MFDVFLQNGVPGLSRRRSYSHRRITYDVAVNLKRRASIGVPKLPLNHLRRSSRIEKERRVGMTECVKTTPWNP